MTRATHKNRGFTAVEIAMVASVIAILALLVLPIFRQRAEEARLSAAHDEMSSLVKALVLIEADMPGGNYLVQLSDLDNRENTALTAPGGTPDLDPPVSRWDSTTGTFEVSPTNYSTIAQNWRGPYVAMRNFISVGQLASQYPQLANLLAPGTLAVDRYPLDPWGAPYVLFGPEETIYNVRALISTGRDTAPGNGGNNYGRRAGQLGTADDLIYSF